MKGFQIKNIVQSELIEFPRSGKQAIVISTDIIMALTTTWAAFSLKLDLLHWPTGSEWIIYLLAPLLSIPIFIKLGLYRAIFRYTGLSAMIAISKAVSVYGITYTAIIYWLALPRVTISIGLLQSVLFLIMVGGSRAFARIWLSGLSADRHQRTNLGRLLIYGAGAAGVQTAGALLQSRQFTLIGFLDDDKHFQGKTINGLHVYAPADAEDIIVRNAVTDVLLALPSVSRSRRNEILDNLKKYQVHIRSLPGLVDLAQGKITVSDIQELEIEDLLGREPVPPNPILMSYNITHKVILVTGAGGSIGSELCRQILTVKPSKLLLLEHNEFSLYTIHAELQSRLTELSPYTEIIPLLGSVCNYQRMSEVCRVWKPNTIYHAAAYKHVPLVEHNPAEGMRNNVFGTLNAARASIENGVSHFVLISTDKAVRPTNIMGASKRLAEMILQALSKVDFPAFETVTPVSVSVKPAKNVTCFSMVRFGNVLGSSGSVVPLFQKQIKDGGPITLTDTEVTRYFMTIPEAAQLVIQASAMSEGGDVFVLDMGKPVKVLDLAYRIIELSGLKVKNPNNPDGDIEIAITGLRPGEKLYEELLIGENPKPTSHTRIMKAHENFVSWDILRNKLNDLSIFTEKNDILYIQGILSELVSGFNPSKKVVDLVWIAEKEAI